MKYFILFLFLFVIGCSEDKVKPEDFALHMVNGLIKSGVTDARALEEKINNPAINNIDVNKDGTIDYIMVREDNSHHFTYIAHPKSGADVPFASTSFEQNGEDVSAHSRFFDTVPDYNRYYYNDNIGHNHAFALWLYSPRPIYVPVIPHTYTYRSTTSRTTFTNIQRSYQSRNNITSSNRQVLPQSRQSVSKPSVPSTPDRSRPQTFADKLSSNKQSKSESSALKSSPSIPKSSFSSSSKSSFSSSSRRK